MTENYGLNETLFAEIGPPRMSAQLRWNYFFSYVAYVGAFVSCALFQGPYIYRTFREQWRSRRSGDTEPKDKLTQMIRKYPSIPLWWNLALFVYVILSDFWRASDLTSIGFQAFVGHSYSPDSKWKVVHAYLHAVHWSCYRFHHCHSYGVCSSARIIRKTADFLLQI